jgi:hypothetical protein
MTRHGDLRVLLHGWHMIFPMFQLPSVARYLLYGILWAFFQGNQNLISNDNLHPTDAGFGAYRQQWANAMLAAVYKT